MASPLDAIVNTSALVALMLRESDAADCLKALGQTWCWRIAAAKRRLWFDPAR